MPAGDMTTKDVRTAALEALVQAERYSNPEQKAAHASIALGYARIYATDVERDS